MIVLVLIALAPGAATAGNTKSAKKKPTGTLSVVSSPWAEVFVDGKKVGNTPVLNKSLPVGKHQVVLVNDELGIEKSFGTTIVKNTDTKIVTNLSDEGDVDSVALTEKGKKKGKITVTSNPWTSVEIDGESVGNTPLIEVKVAPGVHKVRLVNGELEIDVKITVTVKAGETTKVVESF
jgi:hypothetical protein